MLSDCDAGNDAFESENDRMRDHELKRLEIRAGGKEGVDGISDEPQSG